MGAMSFLDRDNDGSSLDDGFTMAAGLGGLGLGGLGGLATAAGTGMAGVGGALMTLGGMESLTGVGAIAGVPTALIGAGLIGGGALLGVGGAGAVAGGAMLGGAATTGLAEEAGDFTADVLGMRGASPFAGKECTDPQYASGNGDALGQQIHDLLFGATNPIAPGTPAAEPSLADVL